MKDLTLVELAQAIEDGKQPQGKDIREGWVEIQPQDALYNFISLGADHVRIDPTLNPVDMSVLVGSGVLCEFWSCSKLIPGKRRLGFVIRGSNTNNLYASNSGVLWEYCQPKMDYWFSALNFDDSGGLVEALKGAGFIIERQIIGLLVGFKITGIQEGRCMPWEVE